MRIFAALGAATLLYAATPTIDPKLYLDNIKFLASQDLKGRATGSPELEKAAQYISGKFKEFGIKPADGKQYFQPFEVTTSAKPGKNNSFKVNTEVAATSEGLHAVELLPLRPPDRGRRVRRVWDHRARSISMTTTPAST